MGDLAWRVAPLVALAVVGLGVASGLSTSADATRALPQRSTRELFLRDCAICHGGDGRGGEGGPSLRGTSAAAVDYWLSTGRMPLREQGATPHRSTPAYPRHVIHALVRYVTHLTGGNTTIPHVNTRTADVAEGGVLFRLQCAACHSWSGEGGALLEREAPETHAATATQIAEAIRTGPGTMPSFGRAALDRAQLADVVAYTRALDSPDDRGGLALGHLGPLVEGAVAIVIGLGLLIAATRWIGTRT